MKYLTIEEFKNYAKKYSWVRKNIDESVLLQRIKPEDRARAKEYIVDLVVEKIGDINVETIDLASAEKVIQSKNVNDTDKVELINKFPELIKNIDGIEKSPLLVDVALMNEKALKNVESIDNDVQAKIVEINPRAICYIKNPKNSTVRKALELDLHCLNNKSLIVDKELKKNCEQFVQEREFLNTIRDLKDDQKQLIDNTITYYSEVLKNNTFVLSEYMTIILNKGYDKKTTEEIQDKVLVYSKFKTKNYANEGFQKLIEQDLKITNLF